MADRYQDRPFPAGGDQDRRGDQHAPGKAEGDPLAELARLIGQTDPFAGMGRANQQVPPRGGERDQYQRAVAADEPPAATTPQGMQRATRPEIPQRQEVSQRQELPPVEYPQEYPGAVHPLHRRAPP